ncbi:hypothetical protein CAC42_4719 [Sphaceloma murrayae]|uniref:Arginyl-tRNA--protein transferase 1 n=1 Tax=Sphaceloma murrayae TaxID=2082308 RepID=A0A2K1QNS0_9PEZI|nr:hypothetical protein CAC42_4719 [Sphaceloma murrayae]
MFFGHVVLITRYDSLSPRYGHRGIKDSQSTDGTSTSSVSSIWQRSPNDFQRRRGIEHVFPEPHRRLSRDREKKEQQTFDLIRGVHEAETSSLKPVQPAHSFEVKLEPASFTDEKYALFRDYQTNVHKEGPSEITKAGFRRFLCDSPLIRGQADPHGKQKLLGSYHQCYRLDGRLIAMGVLDLLPHAVSGVYFLYHRDVEKWSFGKLSALRESALALEGDYEYYYMGYYIHSCRKMKYKGDYQPQYLLDPVSYEWHSMSDMKPRLDQTKFVSLSTAMKMSDTDETGSDMHMASALTSQDSIRPATRLSDSQDEHGFVGPDGTQWMYKSAVEAGNSGDSLFKIKMPGIPTADELLTLVDLDDIDISLGPGFVVQTKDLNTWEEQTDITDGKSLKGVIAEMAACVGPQVAMSMAVDFSRQ